MNNREHHPLEGRVLGCYALLLIAIRNGVRDMTYTFKRALAFLSAISLATCVFTACEEDSDDDDKGQTSQTGKTDTAARPNNSNQQPGDTGYSSSCVPVSDKEMPDWHKTGKSEIVDYLVSICKLSEYFKGTDFLNKPADKQIIGEPCFCFGPACNYAGYERPELQESMSVIKGYTDVANGIIYGCDGVDKSYKGATRACLRSTNVEGIKPAIYFPNGMCILAMSKCNPSNECPEGDMMCNSPEDAIKLNNDTICGFAKFGEYDPDNFTECPNGEVLMDFVMSISIASLKRSATLDVRGCFPGCKQDSDCHGYNIYDPIVNERSQLKCVTAKNEDGSQKAGVCFDMRTVEANAEGYRDLKLVNPGNYAQ